MGRCTAVFTVRVGTALVGALMLSACASVSLGRAEEGVQVSLGRVSWQRQDDQFHMGHIVLKTEGEDVDDWMVSMLVPSTTFAERRPLDVSNMPFGSRIFLEDGDDREYRALDGTLSLSRRGGGYLDALFAEPGEEADLELSLSWTSWHVDDRRILGGGDHEDGDTVRSLAE